MPELKKTVKKMDKPYAPKSDEEIKRIATEIFHGRVLTDRHLPSKDTTLLFAVFLPLTLSGRPLAEWMEANGIKMIYGETKDTFGRAVNGYPVFSAIGFLNEEDTKKVWEVHDKIKAAVDSV